MEEKQNMQPDAETTNSVDSLMSDLATRLKDLAPTHEAVEALADASGISVSQIYRIMGGAATRKPTITALAQAAGVHREWFVTGKGRKWLEKEAPSDIAEPGGEYSFIPLYDVHASAGHGAIVDSEVVADDLSFKTEWINNELHVNAADLYLIYVQGDSMEPAMRAGDIILVNRVNQAISADGIYVLQMEGTLLVKRLQRLPGNRIRITSDNPAYQPFEMELAALDADGNALVGRVVWIGRRI